MIINTTYQTITDFVYVNQPLPRFLKWREVCHFGLLSPALRWTIMNTLSVRDYLFGTFSFPFAQSCSKMWSDLEPSFYAKGLSHSRIMWKIIVRIMHVYSLHFVQSGSYSISREPLFSECTVTLNKFSF